MQAGREEDPMFRRRYSHDDSPPDDQNEHHHPPQANEPFRREPRPSPSHYKRKIWEYFGQLGLTIGLMVLFMFMNKPFTPSKNESKVELWLYIFLGSYVIRVLAMWWYMHTSLRRGTVENGWQILYFLLHLLAFSLFLSFNVYLYKYHEFTSIPSFYDVLLIVTLALGYIYYYELGVIVLIIMIVMPIFCCVACCCPRRGNVPSWSPTPQALLARLTRTQFSQNQHLQMKECIICQQDYEEGDKLITLDCDERHYFHEECIEEWLKRNGVCPICRMPVSLLSNQGSR